MRSPRRKAPSVPASLQRSASASNRRFSLPENWRRLAIATTSGSRRAAASEAVSPVALRAPSATASEEETNDPFIEDFSNEVMCMSYLYSKLPDTGVSPHIGTGGSDRQDVAAKIFTSTAGGDFGNNRIRAVGVGTSGKVERKRVDSGEVSDTCEAVGAEGKTNAFGGGCAERFFNYS